jgi:hypothetical protein
MSILSYPAIAAAALAVGGVACSPAASPAAAPGAVPAPVTTSASRVSSDSMAATLVPAGYGTLRQDDIAIVLAPDGVRVTAIPLDESIIRVLAPDSYRTLRAMLDGKRQQILQRARMRGIREPRVWYLRFYGLAPNARFVPTDLTITSAGRDYRPFDVIPITPGFGEQRLQPRETQSGLLLFDPGVDVEQPLVVSMGAERNTDWSNDRGDLILGRIEAERASIRARAGRPTSSREP